MAGPGLNQQLHLTTPTLPSKPEGLFLGALASEGEDTAHLQQYGGRDSYADAAGPADAVAVAVDASHTAAAGRHHDAASCAACHGWRVGGG